MTRSLLLILLFSLPLPAAAQQVDGLWYPPLLWRDEGTDAGRSSRAVNCVGSPIACTNAAGVTTITVSAGAVTVTAASLNMSGETKKRFTIADAAVSATSKIVITAVRPTVTQDADEGHSYDVTVVSRGIGTFDVLIRVDDPDADFQPPTETIEVHYVVG